MPMELNRRELKAQARERMRETRPPFWLVTLVYLLLTNTMLARGVALEPKKVSGGAAAGSPAFVRLQDVSRQLEALISRSRGRPNKDLARLADQIKQVMENWEN